MPWPPQFNDRPGRWTAAGRNNRDERIVEAERTGRKKQKETKGKEKRESRRGQGKGEETEANTQQPGMKGIEEASTASSTPVEVRLKAAMGCSAWPPTAR